MENTAREKNNWEKFFHIVFLIVLLAVGLFILFSFFGGSSPKTQHFTTSELINTKDIAALSVSEFVHNGIVRTYKENGEHDYNVLYKSTVKVSINADSIGHTVDEAEKKGDIRFSGV